MDSDVSILTFAYDGLYTLHLFLSLIANAGCSHANEPADGDYDFTFTLYDEAADGNQKGNTIDENESDVIDGYFRVELDFGSGVFDGNTVWLEIGVRAGELTWEATIAWEIQARPVVRETVILVVVAVGKDKCAFAGVWVVLLVFLIAFAPAVLTNFVLGVRLDGTVSIGIDIQIYAAYPVGTVCGGSSVTVKLSSRRWQHSHPTKTVSAHRCYWSLTRATGQRVDIPWEQ